MPIKIVSSFEDFSLWSFGFSNRFYLRVWALAKKHIYIGNLSENSCNGQKKLKIFEL